MTLQGRIHHFFGVLQPDPGRKPAFLSLYIQDTDFDVQSELRSQNIAGVDRALLTSFASRMNQKNTFIPSYMSLHELAQDNAPTDIFKLSFMQTRDLRMSTCPATMGRLALKLLL